MSESIKEQSNASALAQLSTKQIVAWSAGVSGMVIVCVSLGVLSQRVFHHRFLGDQTQLVHLCKKNPKTNPDACAELLAARPGTSSKQVSASRDNIGKPSFTLSDDTDADLKPPPDLLR